MFFNRQISQRKINHNRQLNTNTAKYTTMAEGDNSNGYQNAYDLTYNVGDYGYKEYESPTYETGWTSAGEPQQTHQGSFWSGSSGSWEPPPYGIGGGYLTDQGPSSKPIDWPSKKPTKNDQNSLQPKVNNVDWKTIGVLALIKLGLAKLQAIGFLKTLFLLGFSFKMYMIAVIFKFMLIMKLMKFFKILLLPLFLVRLLPSLIQLLMMPGRILDLLRRVADSYNMQGNQLGGLLPSQPGGLLPSQPGGLLPNQPGGLLPSRPGGLLPGQLPNRPAPMSTPGNVRRSDMGKDIPINESTTVNHNIIGKINDPLFKLEDTHLINVQKNDSIPITNSTLENFQKLLESEKCVERIACQISLAEKTGNIPVWIDW